MSSSRSGTDFYNEKERGEIDRQTERGRERERGGRKSKPKNIKLDLAVLESNQTLREKHSAVVQNKLKVLGEVEVMDR